MPLPTAAPTKAKPGPPSIVDAKGRRIIASADPYPTHLRALLPARSLRPRRPRLSCNWTHSRCRDFAVSNGVAPRKPHGDPSRLPEPHPTRPDQTLRRGRLVWRSGRHPRRPDAVHPGVAGGGGHGRDGRQVDGRRHHLRAGEESVSQAHSERHTTLTAVCPPGTLFNSLWGQELGLGGQIML